ncbi:MAG TPA: hypothetical protein VFZ59_21750 [Verrucomicrobiae bacterium]|nr:hypothetical protein [Verrucomicrobiae bacterium]
MAKLFSAFGTARILTARDPMFLLKYWQIMIIVGVLELALALYLFRGRDFIFKLFGILWLSSNFIFYRMANDLMGITVCPCLGTTLDALRLSSRQSDMLLGGFVLYLFLGSAFLLCVAWSRSIKSVEQSPAPAAPST